MRTVAGSEVAVADGGYRPARQRGFALVLTALVFCLPLVLVAVPGWRQVTSPAPAAPHVAAFDVADRPETEDAPAPEEEEPEAEPVSSAAAQPSPPVPAPTLIGAGRPVPPSPATPAAASLPVPDARPAAAPPAPKKRPSGGDQGPDTWHARVLGRLNAVKTYPSSARARRQQGTVMVRFTVDRKGQVLSVALQKTSGFAPLDREALALPKRTSPLPPPPEDVAGEAIELIVPVEFYF